MSGDRSGPRVALVTGGSSGIGLETARGLSAEFDVVGIVGRNPKRLQRAAEQLETGFLEDIWNEPTKDVYSYTDDPGFPPVPDEVVITFEHGIPVALDGQKVTPLQAIQELNRRAGAHGIGRIECDATRDAGPLHDHALHRRRFLLVLRLPGDGFAHRRESQNRAIRHAVGGLHLDRRH